DARPPLSRWMGLLLIRIEDSDTSFVCFLTIDPVVARPAMDRSRPVQLRPLGSVHPSVGSRVDFAAPFHPFSSHGGTAPLTVGLRSVLHADYLRVCLRPRGFAAHGQPRARRSAGSAYFSSASRMVWPRVGLLREHDRPKAKSLDKNDQIFACAIMAVHDENGGAVAHLPPPPSDARPAGYPPAPGRSPRGGKFIFSVCSLSRPSHLRAA